MLLFNDKEGEHSFKLGSSVGLTFTWLDKSDVSANAVARFLLAAPPVSTHVTARKKSMLRLMRLLRKSTVRDEPCAPDFCDDGSCSRSPQASLSTVVPVAVKW